MFRTKMFRTTGSLSWLVFEDYYGLYFVRTLKYLDGFKNLRIQEIHLGIGVFWCPLVSSICIPAYSASGKIENRLTHSSTPRDLSVLLPTNTNNLQHSLARPVLHSKAALDPGALSSFLFPHHFVQTMNFNLLPPSTIFLLLNPSLMKHAR